ncbi:MAG: VWA domain-containing protein [Gammaproteobacteria bacterium]|nr:VWA domain-containing protein [Gammaproteobacteria bacterium]
MIEFFFKYPLSVFNDSDFIFASGWPLWVMFVAALAFLVIISVLMVRQAATLRWLQLGTIGFLQFLMFTLVLVVLWQPALVSERLLQGENAVAIMLDTSGSMTFNEGGNTRMEQAQALLTPDALEDISSIYKILPYRFSDSASEMDSFALLPEPGESTNLGQAITQTLRQASSSSLGAVILISDGSDNSGAISQADLTEIAGYGVPIHAVGLGREDIPEDLELTEVSLPEKALPGTTLTARIGVRHDQGGTARVKVYDGDTFLTTEEIILGDDQNMTLAFVDIEVSDPGQLDLRFTLDPINNESNLANNTRAQVVDVEESRYKVLYVEGEPRWEYKFMQRALNDDPSIQLSTLLKVTPNKYYRQGIESQEQLENGFPEERTELFDYDALIIGSFNAAELTADQQEMIRDFVSERGGSLLMLGGLNGLGLGGWGESVVNEVLPSRLNADQAEFVREKSFVTLTDSGKLAPLLQLSGSELENERIWADLPEVADYQQLGPLRPAATTLLNVNVDGRMQPLLVTQPYGRGQSYILATGGTWRWQMSLPVADMSHETFWRQLTRALVANSPRPFELSSRVDTEEIKVRAELRDPESEENQGLAISAVVSSENNDVVTLELLPITGQPGVYEASFSPNETGLYSIEAISRVGENLVGSSTTAVRYDQGQEIFNVRQNRQLLERVAEITGGQYWTVEEWNEIPEAISFSTAGITEQQISFLWDAPFFFFLLVLLKTMEWLLRRHWRTI